MLQMFDANYLSILILTLLVIVMSVKKIYGSSPVLLQILLQYLCHLCYHYIVLVKTTYLNMFVFKFLKFTFCKTLSSR